MSIPRLLILPLLICACIAQPLPGNVRRLRNFRYYGCFESFESVVQTPADSDTRNPFRSPVQTQPPPTAFSGNRIILTRLVPPPELRVRDLALLNASGVSLQTAHRWLCQGIDVDGKGRIH
jgi:hypothetical protein